MGFESIEPFLGTWGKHLRPFVDDRMMANIKVVGQLYGKVKCYPNASNTFKAFVETSYFDTKVVILGQDPYPNENATGLAFDCGVSPSPSMLKIAEAYADYDPMHFNTKILDGRTEQWCKEGVLLLNTSLTVEAGKPNSHKEYWLGFTQAVIKALNQKEHVIYLLWGREAQNYSIIINPEHKTLMAEHPAEASYNNRKWVHNNCFKKTNELLKLNNLTEIKW